MNRVMCSCHDCHRLNEFLGQGKRTLVFELPAERRYHITAIIEAQLDPSIVNATSNSSNPPYNHLNNPSVTYISLLAL